jgi:ribosomal protein S18 acetylase RimI-like enzyme
MLIRKAGREDEDLLVRHYRAVWESYGVPDEFIRMDAEHVVLDFIEDGRARYQLAGFLAVVNDRVIGSTACQLHRLPYPDVTVPNFRKFGYIWHVFVEADARRQGVASLLVQAAVAYLGAIGCTKAVLHASDAGEPVYQRLGFQIAKEMRLDIQPSNGEWTDAGLVAGVSQSAGAKKGRRVPRTRR